MRPDYLLTALRINVQILRELVASVSEEVAARRIGQHWTVREHVEHLVTCHRVLLARIEHFLSAPSPVITPYNPSEPVATGVSFMDSVAAFESIRERQLTLLEGAESSAWSKAAAHPEYRGPYTLTDLARHVALHDGFHLYRIEELLLLKPDYVPNL